MRASYVVPSTSEGEQQILGWLREQVQDADNYLRSQRAYRDLDIAYDIIAGEDLEQVPQGLSDAASNRLKRGIREVVATVANLRLMGAYKTRSEEFKETEEVLNNLLRAWWRDTFADRSMRKGFQWAAALGTGWLSPIWELGFGTYGRGDIKLYTYGPRDVKPSQIPRDHDIQKAYMVTLVAETPINLARALHPLHADRIHPDRGEPTWARKGVSWVQRNMPLIFRILGGEKDDAKVGFPTVDIHYSYIMDASVNGTGRRIAMGKPGSSWAYEVPYKGQPIPTNIYRGGEPIMREAGWEDIRLYPNRRLVVWTNSGILYDDTSPYWHGMVPLVKITTDDWPWEFLGFSMLRDGYPLQKSFNRLMRGIDHSVQGRLNASMQYNQDSVSEAAMSRMDPRFGGRHIPVDFSMGDVVKPFLPIEYYRLEPHIQQHLETLRNEMDYLMAIRDMSNVAKANQIPSDETIEKLLQLAGPLVTDITRGIESGLTDLFKMMKSNFFQFYDAPHRFSILGPDGITKQDFDFDPGMLVPSHIPGQDPRVQSPSSPADRQRWYAQQFTFDGIPNSGLQIAQLSQRMIMMQLWRAGFPIDPWTLAEKFEIANFGSPPDDAKDVISRWRAWLASQSEFTATLQAIAALRSSGMAAPPPAAAGAGAAGTPQQGPGRPPSGERTPHIETKDGGARQTVSETR